MQRTLYDPADAAKIWKKFTQEVFAEEDESLDLLGALGDGDFVKDGVIAELGEFEEDELVGFEDLLSAEDDELLVYMEERDRLSA